MGLKEGLSFLCFAFEQEVDSLLFQRWAFSGIRPACFEMSFDEFKQRIIPQQEKPVEEVLARAEEILEAFDRERGLIP